MLMNLRSSISRVCRDVILDLGSGLGNSVKMVLDICVNAFVIGTDIDCKTLSIARERVRDLRRDLVCCDISMLPIRSSSLPMVFASMTIHEVREDAVELVLREVRRVLMDCAHFVILDKFADLYQGAPPSEELVMLVENAFHKAMEYVYGVKVYGIKPLSDFIARASDAGFEVSMIRKVMVSPWRDGETFLRG